MEAMPVETQQALPMGQMVRQEATVTSPGILCRELAVMVQPARAVPVEVAEVAEVAMPVDKMKQETAVRAVAVPVAVAVPEKEPLAADLRSRFLFGREGQEVPLRTAL
jgi:hypothetical protein